MLKIVQRIRDSRLDLAGSSRLASRQKLYTCQACREVEPSCQLQHYRTKSPVWPFSYLAAQSSREAKPPASSVLEKLTLRIPNTYKCKYPLYPRIVESFQRETLEKNKIDSSLIFTQRLFKFLYSHPLHCYILERYITKTFSHHTHICEKAIWCLGSSQEGTNFILVDAIGYSGIR